MRHIFLLLTILLATATLQFAQSDVVPDGKSPYFQGQIRVKGYFGTDSNAIIRGDLQCDSSVRIGDTLFFGDGTYMLTAALSYADTLTWLDPVNSFQASFACTPGDSSNRFIASATGGGWTINNIYECDGSSWAETVPVSGDAVVVIDSAKVFIFDGVAWLSVSISSPYWAASGTNITNVNAGSVLVGTASPTIGYKFKVLGNSYTTATSRALAFLAADNQGLRTNTGNLSLRAANNNSATGAIIYYTNNGGTIAEQGRTLATGDWVFGVDTVFKGSGRFSIASSYKNMSLGWGAGKSLSSGIDNVYMGYMTGYFDETGRYNTALGNYALQSNVSGRYNIAIGYQALLNNTANSNVAIGFSAGYSNTIGLYNTFIGYQAGEGNISGNANTFIGYRAGESDTTGYGNLFAGYQAGLQNTKGYGNVFLGADAGRYNDTAWANIFIGPEAGLNNLNGNSNTFIGSQSGLNNTEGSGNVFLGVQAGFFNQTGYSNTFLGAMAGINNTANRNTFIGDSAGYSNTTGTGNIFSGFQTGYSNVGGIYNSYYGYQAGYSNVSGIRNVSIGDSAGYGSTVSYNVYIGSNAAFTNPTGEHNVVIGNGAANSQTYGNSICIGSGSIMGHTTIGGISMGRIAENAVNYGVAIGYAATNGGADITNAFGTAVGANSYAMKWGASFGYAAGLNDRTTATGNTYMGYESGRGTTGRATNYNTAVGYSSLYSLVNGAINNTAIGSEAGYTNAAANNLFVGYQSGYNNTTGTPNTYIGYQAGYSNLTGTGNIMLGYQAGYSETGSNYLYIENSDATTPLIKGDFNLNTLNIHGGLSHDNWVNVLAYGAIGDGVTDNTTAFQNAINSRSADKDITLYIPCDTFLLANTIRIKNFRNVRIIGDNAILINGLGVVDTLINITSDSLVFIEGVRIDMNNKVSQADVGMVVQNVRGKVSVEKCYFYNFGTWNATGLWLYDVGNISSSNGYNEGTAYSVYNCGFYNDNLIDITTYDWTSNNSKGIGIIVKDSAEYGRIHDCDFMNLSGGITLDGGANTTFENNNIELINAYQGGALQLSAGIYIKDCAGNNGKTTIVNNKFNHNWTSAIKCDYDAVSTRPLLISNNQFIANQYDPVVIGNSGAFNLNTITNNFFDRCHNSLVIGTYPFTGNRAFIKLTNSSLNDISHNSFFQSPNYAIMSYGTGSNKVTSNFYYAITTKFDSLTGRNLTFGNVDVTDLDENMFGDSLLTSAFVGIGQDANVYSGSLVIANSGGGQTNVRTAASSSTGGGSITLYSDDAGTNSSGDRLGYYAFGGRKTSGLTVGATIEGFAGGAFATNFNTEISLFTTNTTSRTKKMTIMGSGGLSYPTINSGNVVAATGLTTTMCSRMSYYNGGSAIDISAVPQIADGLDGQIMTIIGSSDANTLTLDDANGLQLAGGVSFVIGSGDTITLIYISALDLWVEQSRSDN